VGASGIGGLPNRPARVWEPIGADLVISHGIRPTGRNRDGATASALIRGGARPVTPLNAKLNAST